MSFFKSFFTSEAKAVEVYTTPPILVNNRSDFVRNVHRLVNLYRAVRQGDLRKELEDEIDQRRNSCLDFGHPIPYNLEEAEALKQKVTR